ncbi:MAG: hypothetical protein WD404_09560 [Solirubrobacterales bacterium]
MAFVVPRKNGSWEIRETRSGPSGPRSRTLASFRELNDEVIARAQTRSDKQLDRDALRRSALRAGAPLATPPADRAAQQLLAELGAGRKPRRALRHLLDDAVTDRKRRPFSESGSSVGEWLLATPEEHGDTLRELLLLADALPQRRRLDRIQFPRFGRA